MATNPMQQQESAPTAENWQPGGWKRMYVKPMTQVIILGCVCFLLPGMFNAINGLGAVGKADATITDNANTALAVTFAVCSLLAGGLFNLVGHRVLLFVGGLTFILYIGSYLSYNAIFVITSGAILGVGAGFLWTAQGAIMMSYPEENHKGLYISIFWSIFNSGAIIGSLVSLALNWHNTLPHVSSQTYLGFMGIMAVGCLLTFALLPPTQVLHRGDGSQVATTSPQDKNTVRRINTSESTTPPSVLSNNNTTVSQMSKPRRLNQPCSGDPVPFPTTATTPIQASAATTEEAEESRAPIKTSTVLEMSESTRLNQPYLVDELVPFATTKASVATEAMAILKLFRDKRLLLLSPMFFSSNWFYTYQFNAVNGGGMFTVRTRSLNGVLYWMAQLFGSCLMGRLLDLPRVKRSRRALLGVGFLFVATMAVWGGGFAFQETYTRETAKSLTSEKKIDLASSRRYAGPMVLYALYGLFDAMWQTYCYWLMGALTNETAMAARMAGFYKAWQNAGAACAGQVDANKVSYDVELLLNWGLLVLGLVCAVPVAWTLQDTLQKDLEGNPPL